jgi:hypothetical protein
MFCPPCFNFCTITGKKNDFQALKVLRVRIITKKSLHETIVHAVKFFLVNLLVVDFSVVVVTTASSE